MLTGKKRAFMKLVEYLPFGHIQLQYVPEPKQMDISSVNQGYEHHITYSSHNYRRKNIRISVSKLFDWR